MLKFNPSEEFKFVSPREWTEWKQRFSHFRLGTKLNREDREMQVCLLIYAMGSEAEKMLKNIIKTTILL